ncbi:MAG: hypothetical protein Kow0077_14580 [Anaerolineae bacterium]
MRATYHVQVDWDDDGDFDRPEETLDRDVIALEWALGLDDPGATLAAASWARITLRNPLGRYLPESASSPLAGAIVPRKRMRITSTYDGVTRTHFTGWLEQITPGRDLTVTLVCGGLEGLLQRAEVFLPLLVDVTADAVIGAALAQVDYPPALLGYWQLGLARLGQDTRLPDLTTYADLAPGRTRFAYVGDFQTPVSAWEVLRQAVAAERGLCFVNREGRVVFWNRHHLLLADTPAATLTAREADFTTTTGGAAMVNCAEVTCHPREVGSAPETLWMLRRPLRLPAGQAVTIRAPFDQAEPGVRVGALSLEAMIPGSDYTASDNPAGGADHTAEVAAQVTPAGSSAAITFTSSAGRALYILPGARLRGYAVRDRGQVAVRAEDRLSVLHYGRRMAALDLPLLSALEDAQGVARQLVLDGAEPRATVQTVTLDAQAARSALPVMLATTVGDCVMLEDALTGYSGRVHVLGERHRVARGGAAHTVTWVVRPASRWTYWRLGAAALGTGTRLVY